MTAPRNHERHEKHEGMTVRRLGMTNFAIFVHFVV